MCGCSYVFVMARTSRYLCSGAGDTLVNVWDLDSGAHVAMFQGHANSVTALMASVDETLLFSASRFAYISKLCVVVAYIHSSVHVFCGERDRTIKVWDLESLGAKCTLTRLLRKIIMCCAS